MQVNSEVVVAPPVQIAGDERALPDRCIVKGQCPHCRHGDRVLYRRFVQERRGPLLATARPCLCFNCGATFPLRELLLV